jgi:hypothetical protein
MAVTESDAASYILAMATRPVGVSLAEVADFCGIGCSAARRRVQAACDVHTLYRAQRAADIGGRAQDVRWFADRTHADTFIAAGPPVPDARRAAARTPVQVVAIQRIKPAVRPGADDHLQWGSRRGDRIKYLDGTDVHISETV